MIASSTLLSLIGVAFDEHTLLSLFRLAFSGVFSKLSQRVGLGTSQESGLSSVHVLSSASPCFQTSVLESTCVGEGHVPWVWCLVHRVEVQRCLQLRLSSGQEHDSGNGWRDSVAEELKGVGGNLFRSSSVFRLGSRSHHARLQEDTFKHDIVLSKVKENLSPNLLSNFDSVLHVAAASGQIEILSLLLERFTNPDTLNRHKQTPLMLAAMYGRISCVKKLAQVGANVLMFDSVNRRTCLHYAAYYGHADCVQAILSAAQSSPVAVHWGFARFVNIRDDKGATPLHLAARQRRPECVNVLLDSGSLACASTSLYGSPGSTPLHLAARSGSIDCVRKLLAWGADRLQRDASGRIPYVVAMKHKHGACGALLNPSSAEPLVWPSPLKFISELNEEAKLLLEQALMDANREREKTILKGTAFSLPSPSYSDNASDDNMSEMSDSEMCCICFEQACTIEVKDCGHQMCAQCTLALCCHNKPNPTTSTVTPPVCPFCRSVISRLVIAQNNNNNNDNSKSQDEVVDREAGDVSSSKLRKHRKSMNLGEESSSFMGLSSIGSFGKITGRGSGRIAADNELMDKPIL